MADISKIKTLDGTTYDLKDRVARQQIPFGAVDATSTSTAYTATVPGITSLDDGTCMLLKNGVVTSASGFTININDFGAKPVYNNMGTGNETTPTAPSRETTLFNINYTMLFIYSTTLVDGGCWIMYRGYNSNDNTIGYQLRTNSTVLKSTDRSRYYRIFFTSADGTHWIPANTGYDNSATSIKTVNQRPINPFGRIIYFSASTNISAEANVSSTYSWSQYTFSLGYSFNTTGAELTLTTQKPIYIKCAPQSDGSAIIDATTPYVQDLPITADGKIYIFLGIAYSATNIELIPEHPVYYHDGTSIKLWTGSAHDPTKQDLLVSGTNIKTVGGQSILGSGNIAFGDNGTDLLFTLTDYIKCYFGVPFDSEITESIANFFDDLTSYISSEGYDELADVLESFVALDNPTIGDAFGLLLNLWAIGMELSGGVTSVNGQSGAVVLDADDVGALPDDTVIPTVPTNVSAFTNDAGYMTGMTILSYGSSTWNDFITAYNSNKVVYCRASSNSNPASGAQTRLAFMAYVNNATPTNVEFQYYRSVSSHSDTQQGDQVYVYKLDKTAGWSVTVRESYTKIVAGTGLTSSYSNGELTISSSGSGGSFTPMTEEEIWEAASEGWGTNATMTTSQIVDAVDNGWGTS